MTVTRREFLVISGAVGAGLALSSLGIDMGPVRAYADDLKKIDKIKTASRLRQSVRTAQWVADLSAVRTRRTRKLSTSREIRTIPSTKVLCAPKVPDCSRPPQIIQTA